MKKYILIGIMMMANVIFAQNEPELEIVGQLVKATYYHDNGTIAQQGFFKDGKLDGKWISYDKNGIISASAEYENGLKVGKWITYKNQVVISEVVYSNNQLVSVTNFEDKFIAKN